MTITGDLFKLVHFRDPHTCWHLVAIEAHMVGWHKRAVCIMLEHFLVTIRQPSCGKLFSQAAVCSWEGVGIPGPRFLVGWVDISGGGYPREGVSTQGRVLTPPGHGTCQGVSTPPHYWCLVAATKIWDRFELEMRYASYWNAFLLDICLPQIKIDYAAINCDVWNIQWFKIKLRNSHAK